MITTTLRQAQLRSNQTTNLARSSAQHGDAASNGSHPHQALGIREEYSGHQAPCGLNSLGEHHAPILPNGGSGLHARARRTLGCAEAVVCMRIDSQDPGSTPGTSIDDGPLLRRHHVPVMRTAWQGHQGEVRRNWSAEKGASMEDGLQESLGSNPGFPIGASNGRHVPSILNVCLGRQA